MFSSAKILPITQQSQAQKQARRRVLNGGGSLRSNRPTFSIVRVFLTHHGRLACLVNLLLTLNSTPGVKKPNRIYLKNNSVVKVVKYFDPDSQMWKIEISLVYEGTLPSSEMSKPKYPYWSLRSLENWQTFQVSQENFYKFFPGESENSINYFMRHGQAVHNQFTALQKWFKPLVKMVNSGGSFWDSLLISNNGIQEAALFILGDLKNNYPRDTVPTSPSSFYYFSSPLRRCLETMSFLILFLSYQEIQQKQQSRQKIASSPPVYSYSITILPCLHELSSVKTNGQCDTISNKLAKTSLFTPENASRCLNQLSSSSKKPKQQRGQKPQSCSDFSLLYPRDGGKYRGKEIKCDDLKNRNQKVNCTLEKLKELMEVLNSKSDFRVDINWSLFKNNLSTDCTKTNVWSFIHNAELTSSSSTNSYITQL
uniref:Uncharacterized protein n=1 Tax=viral metagenome TaxID=1070528 RepID=A0A6C0D0F0_9ZZZZ